MEQMETHRQYLEAVAIQGIEYLRIPNQEGLYDHKRVRDIIKALTEYLITWREMRDTVGRLLV
jgi:hypothetical protein